MTKQNIKISELIMPYFVIPGKNKRQPIKSMPGIDRLTIDQLLIDIERAKNSGINKFILFGVPTNKNLQIEAFSENGIIPQAVSRLKSNISEIIVMTDICLCAYTEHGHCGIINDNGTKVNINKDNTLAALQKMALSHAQAGADYVSPSAMADKQVAVIRQALDINGYRHVKIMGYSAKFASSFYGPFREAAHSAPAFGDRSSYQIDPSDRKRALKEIHDDIKEGADIVMVKPALAYLDIIREAKSQISRPLSAYNVSGEYAMVKFGADKGLWDEKKMVFEIINSIKRAGAELIITYHTKDIAKWLRK